ncbi:MAG: response regulator [Acidobacteria bacterium]|nr:response regulator [Acidobacteriota bacterium]
MRVVVVDDEEPARAVLREYLSALDGVEIVAECANGFEAVKAAAELNPDLLLLDIQMPKLDGFEVLELIDREVEIVFVTAYDSFAIRAFEVHAADYLLKPFSAERLAQAIGNARERLGRKVRSRSDLIAEARGRIKPVDRVLVRDGARVHVIQAGDVDYIQAQDDYACIRSGGREHLKQESMSALEEALDPRRFVRIHRTYILNIDRLARIELYAKDSRIAILRDGTKLPISRAGYARLKPLLR